MIYHFVWLIWYMQSWDGCQSVNCRFGRPTPAGRAFNTTFFICTFTFSLFLSLSGLANQPRLVPCFEHYHDIFHTLHLLLDALWGSPSIISPFSLLTSTFLFHFLHLPLDAAWGSPWIILHILVYFHFKVNFHLFYLSFTFHFTLYFTLLGAL